MRRAIAILLVLTFILWVNPSAQAQAPAPQLVAGTVPISPELKASIEAYLAEHAPSAAPFYAPTYVQYEGTFTLISLAGILMDSSEDEWRIEGREGAPSNVIWIGTVRIEEDGSGSLFSAQRQASLPRLAIPILPAPGGSPGIMLPFQPGAALQFGVRGIHGSGDYGTSGMYAVDLVGGPGLGSNVASATVFASQAGTVDYVCSDTYQTVVRTYNASTDDYFLYAHMYDNANLELAHVFSAGSVIGSLRPGTFEDDCGWTEQGPTIYHNHWMFEPAGGAFRVGQYTIRLSTGKFHTADTTYGVGSWIYNNGSSSGYDDPTGSHTPSFWDWVVAAIASMTSTLANQLPAASTISALRAATNTINLFFRLVFVLLRGTLNLTFAVVVLLSIISLRLTLSVPWVAMWVIRVIRQIKTTFMPGG